MARPKGGRPRMVRLRRDAGTPGCIYPPGRTNASGEEPASSTRQLAHAAVVVQQSTQPLLADDRAFPIDAAWLRWPF